MIAEEIKRAIQEALGELGLPDTKIELEHPKIISHGDFSTNVAITHSRGGNLRELAERIVGRIKNHESRIKNWLEKIEVAGPGFINFFLSPKFFAESVSEILNAPKDFGANDSLKGKKVMVEYTDPNPFKEFHVGHLMSNAVGESISRIIQFHGAEVKRACYQGDVGLHVAKAIWGMKKKKIHDSRFTIQDLGEAYALGAEAYDTDEKAKQEIVALNKVIFEKSDSETQALYDSGRKVSLEYFDEIYKKLGTKFDFFFFESEAGSTGKEIVLEFLKKGVFEKSEGAIIFKGENHGLHTRVFINKEGLPTYEAKEIALPKIKHDKYPYDVSVILTGNEVNDYFRVLLCALGIISPELAKKTKHLSHGMLRLPTGKMSSRTGNVVTAEHLIDAVSAMVHKKLEERELETPEKNKIAEAVAVGAIKYSVLRQHVGGDIIFDFEKSISFEGDSGPYLQYSYARAESVLRKAGTTAPEVQPQIGKEVEPRVPTLLEKLLYRFPEIVARAGKEYAPHYIATFLIELAGAFNNFYATHPIIGSGADEPYRLALTRAFSIVLKNGLWLLGIQAPEKM